MIYNARLPLLLIAFWATIWAAIAFFTGFEADFKVAAIVAALSLGGVFWLDHLAKERERMAHGRDAVWRRRIEELDDWEEWDIEVECLREVD
jgi:hypothetical protein